MASTPEQTAPNPEEGALGVGVQVLTAAMLAWTPSP